MGRPEFDNLLPESPSLELGFDTRVLLYKLMEVNSTQHVHVTVGQCSSCENGGKQLLEVAEMCDCLSAYLQDSNL